MMVLLMMEERVQKETDEAENHFGHVKKEKITLKFLFGFSISGFLDFKYILYLKKEHVLKMKAKYC